MCYGSPVPLPCLATGKTQLWFSAQLQVTDFVQPPSELLKHAQVPSMNTQTVLCKPQVGRPLLGYSS